MTVLYIGNHTSSSKGYAAMARQIIKNGGNTFAFFTRNPRGGKAKAIDETDIQNFLVLAQENHFGKIVAHAPYTFALQKKNFELLRVKHLQMIFDEWNIHREIIIIFIREVM